MYKLSQEEFINRANSIHKNKYTYEKVIYKDTKTSVIINCLKHGYFTTYPSNHLHKTRPTGCPYCSRGIINLEIFVERSNKVHNNIYNYSKFKYKNRITKSTIICPNNHKFKQAPDHHMRGRGCPKCNKVGWSRTSWLKIANKHKQSCVYIIRCFNKNENFIKIGKTSTSIIQRFWGKGNMPYSYEIIKEIKGSPDFVWDKEIALHRLYKQYKYKPKLNFGGITECYNICVLPFTQFSLFN